VYRYTPGKLDWLAAGLPIEGTEASRPRIVDRARRDVPTCRLADPLETVHARVRAVGWNRAVVVANDGVVLGLLHLDRLHDATPSATVAEHMMGAPVTVRPHLSPDELPEAARRQEVFLVTTSDGVLLGLVSAAEIAKRARPTEPRRARRPGQPGLVIGPTTGGSDVQIERW
jgi:hypothetical protein